jgi:hypothetical protein
LIATYTFDDLPACKCNADHPAEQDIAPVAGGSGTNPIVVGSNGAVQSDNVELVTSSSSSGSETETVDDTRHRKQRKAKRVRNKVLKSSNNQNEANTQLKANNASLRAAPAPTTYKEIYVGNVDPKNTVADVVEHVKQNVCSITLSDVEELYKGQDAKSFHVKVPDSDYDKVVNSTWPKGIKVRQFYPKSRGGPGKTSRNRAGQRSRNQQKRNPTQSNQPFRPTYGYWSYPEHDQYDAEWPPLPRSSGDHQWDWRDQQRDNHRDSGYHTSYY